MKTAIVIGSSGQDGSILTEKLLADHYRVVKLDRNGSVNITKTEHVFSCVDEEKPHEIYHLAAFHHSSEDLPIDLLKLVEQSYIVNVFSLIYFLEAIRILSPTTRLFYASSSHVFGAPIFPVQDESHPFNPTSIYGITKTNGVLLCRYYRATHGIFATTGILYNHESHLRTIRFISKKIVRGVVNIKNNCQNKLIVGDLGAEVDWGYAPDYIDAMRKLLTCEVSDDFVIASGEKHTVQEFIEVAFNFVGLDWKKYVIEDKNIITRHENIRVGNPTKLITTTGWQPKKNFHQLIKTLLIEEGAIID